MNGGQIDSYTSFVTVKRLKIGKKLNDNDSRGRRRWSRASVED